MENNNTVLYSLAAIYIALTEAITATFGKSVEPLANRLIKDMLPQMEPDAANLCRDLVRFTSSQEDRRTAAEHDRLTKIISTALH